MRLTLCLSSRGTSLIKDVSLDWSYMYSFMPIKSNNSLNYWMVITSLPKLSVYTCVEALKSNRHALATVTSTERSETEEIKVWAS